MILGTAAYLSPEQVGTGDAGPGSDVYGVGILAYELLTGETPFTGDSALTVAYQRMDHDVPPPSAAIAGVPPQFDEFVTRATARDPANAIADAADMGDELAPDRRSTRTATVPGARTAELRPARCFGGVPQPGRRRTTTPPRPMPHPRHQPILPPRQHTREMTRGPEDWESERLDRQRNSLESTSMNWRGPGNGADASHCSGWWHPDADRTDGGGSMDARQQPAGIVIAAITMRH